MVLSGMKMVINENNGRWSSVYTYTTFVILTVNAVLAQDAFTVNLTMSPDRNVGLKTPVNLTCKFMVSRLDYREVRWSVGGGPSLYHYKDKEVDDQLDIEKSGLILSENGNEYSVQWLLYEGGFCNPDVASGNFKCRVLDQHYSYSESSAKLNFSEPTRQLFFNDNTKLCEGGSTSELRSLALNSTLDIKFSASNERSPIASMFINIQNTSYTNYKNTSSTCPHGAELFAEHTLGEDRVYTIMYGFQFSSGEEIKLECILSLRTEATYIGTGGSGGLGGGAIAGIVIAAIILIQLNIL